MAATVITKKVITNCRGADPSSYGDTPASQVFAPDKVNGDTWANVRGKLVLFVSNTSDKDCTITFATPKTVPEGSQSLAIEDVAVVIPAGEMRIIGPWSSTFEDTNGKIAITTAMETDAATTGVDCFLVQLP